MNRCSIDSRDHHPLWPVLRAGRRTHRGKPLDAGLARFTASGRTATLLSRHPRFGTGDQRKNAKWLHRVDRAALVWYLGEVRLVGARWLCGNESCCCTLVDDPADAPGFEPCPKCEKAAA